MTNNSCPITVATCNLRSRRFTSGTYYPQGGLRELEIKKPTCVDAKQFMALYGNQYYRAYLALLQSIAEPLVFTSILLNLYVCYRIFSDKRGPLVFHVMECGCDVVLIVLNAPLNRMGLVNAIVSTIQVCGPRICLGRIFSIALRYLFYHLLVRHHSLIALAFRLLNLF